MWEQRAATIAAEHHVRVYFPDLPSHGRSAVVRRFDYGDAARAIRAALRRDCPRPALVLGASSGGIVAMKIAAATGARTVAIGVGWSFTPANVTAMSAIAANPSPELTAGFARSAEQGDPQVAALARHYGDLAALGTRPLLARREAAALRGRLLVIWGDRDEFFLRPSVDALVAQIPAARMVVEEGAGHLGPLTADHAADTWREVAAFAAGR